MNYSIKPKKLLNSGAIGLIYIYRRIFSPSVGILRFIPFYPRPSCIFYPTCSEYGVECFKKYPFFTALRKTATRIGRCHPGNEPKVDLP
ncbi:MAG: membrane protein insertion efficiency factor YidD [Candidatus Pacebacteria bacterium]|nr:membrane protein insertion efficiency factor YidD [Candidatus Paceibacterota bacterium]